MFMMSDNGSGGAINIPTFLIRQSSAQEIIASHEKGEHIIMRVSIGNEERRPQVSVDLWFQTTMDFSVEQIETLQSVLPMFNDGEIDFNLRVMTQPCYNCPGIVKERRCLVNGLYCAAEHLYLPARQQDLLSETKESVIEWPADESKTSFLRQDIMTKCVFLVMKDSEEAHHIEWTLMLLDSLVNQECALEDGVLNEATGTPSFPCLER